MVLASNCPNQLEEADSAQHTHKQIARYVARTAFAPSSIDERAPEVLKLLEVASILIVPKAVFGCRLVFAINLTCHCHWRHEADELPGCSLSSSAAKTVWIFGAGIANMQLICAD